MWKHFVFSVAALTVFLASGAAEAQIFEISVEPEEPTPYEDITVRLVNAQGVSLEIAETRREGQQLIIEMVSTCGTIICVPPPPFSEEVVFEPTLQAGTFDLQVRVGDDVLDSREIFVQRYFLDTSLVFQPAEPNDNQTVRAVLALLSWGGVELSEIRRLDRQIDLEMVAPFPQILPPPPEPDAAVLDLGTLEAGEYLIRLYTEDPFGDQRRIWMGELTVQDAPDRVVLQDRFHVTVNWQDFVGNQGVGRPVPGASDDSSLFSFFERSNWELMVKVLDGCQQNGHFWVLTGGATNLAFDIEIDDPITGNTWSVSNPLGQTATAVTDTLALPCE